MTTTASVVLFKNEFIATLSDGRRSEGELREMASALDPRRRSPQRRHF